MFTKLPVHGCFKMLPRFQVTFAVHICIQFLFSDGMNFCTFFLLIQQINIHRLRFLLTVTDNKHHYNITTVQPSGET